MTIPNVDWNSYAEVYDLMAKHNPAYQAIIAQFKQNIKTWNVPNDARLYDLGAGTGNFSLELAKHFPQYHITHVDSDVAMNSLAQSKAREDGVVNIEFVETDLQTFDLAAESVTAISCIHALYALPDPQQVIHKMYRWLKPNGYLFVCDLGRVLQVGDWAKYLFTEVMREHGLLKAVALFYKGRAVAEHNKLIAAAQRSGCYWVHGHTDFVRAFERVGFRVLSSSKTYRGYSDIVLCQK